MQESEVSTSTVTCSRGHESSVTDFTCMMADQRSEDKETVKIATYRP